jgi:hypothetical protein
MLIQPQKLENSQMKVLSFTNKSINSVLSQNLNRSQLQELLLVRLPLLSTLLILTQQSRDKSLLTLRARRISAMASHRLNRQDRILRTIPYH